MTLTEFLLARIAEDEAAAHGVAMPANDGSALGVLRVMTGEHDAPRSHDGPGVAVTASPTRVLAECEAKRQVVAEHPDYGGYGETCATCDDGAVDHKAWPCPTLRALASVYVDHPQYREEWKP